MQVGRKAPKAPSSPPASRQVALAIAETPQRPNAALVISVRESAQAVLAFNAHRELIAASQAVRSGAHGWFIDGEMSPQGRRDFAVELDRARLDLEAHGQSICHIPEGCGENLLLVRFRAMEKGCVLAHVPECIWPAHLDRLLARGFGLTPAEVEIMRGVFEHSSIEALAEIRRRTIRTVRTQLSAIYAKTGLRSQADIVRFVAKLSN